MTQIKAVAFLTVKAAVRSRFVHVFMFMMTLLIWFLPLLIRHDGTAKMFTQIMLTYTLIVMSTMLAASTLWMACGAISREVAECQMQVLAAKPISRWQIWVGKWAGLGLLNLIFLILLGGLIYGLLQFNGRRLTDEQYEMLRNEVLVARDYSVEEKTDRTEQIERVFQERIKEERVDGLDEDLVRRTIEDQFKSMDELVNNNHRRIWEIKIKSDPAELKKHPMFVRVKVQANQLDIADAIYEIHWVVGDIEKKHWRQDRLMAHNNIEEFKIPSELVGDDGTIRIEAWNQSGTTLRFPLTDELRVLYPRGSFEMNYIRSLGVILLWLMGMAALGLCASAFLSFPVASFFAMALLAVFLSGDLLTSISKERSVGMLDHETGESNTQSIDPFVVPIFRALGWVVSLGEGGVDPINNISSGLSVTWGHMLHVFIKINVIASGALAALGIFLFSRREMALVTGGDS
ncbi:MAG: hypothetical protein CMO80_21710 [Verrucomicrobiales bacterium]|nr:hypothetical protein [Verrucomicrobiales bacterium]|tara:strand:- start:3810 stop:5192 length:1383 start_codon:yes stop_codon:yes gene_type:complete